MIFVLQQPHEAAILENSNLLNQMEWSIIHMTVIYFVFSISSFIFLLVLYLSI